jgi:hypothetical protein
MLLVHRAGAIEGHCIIQFCLHTPVCMFSAFPCVSCWFDILTFLHMKGEYCSGVNRDQGLPIDDGCGAFNQIAYVSRCLLANIQWNVDYGREELLRHMYILHASVCPTLLCILYHIHHGSPYGLGSVRLKRHLVVEGL